MPELPNDQRQSIDERLAFHRELRDHYKDRKYTSQQCRLCGWSSNGLTLEEAIQANKEHEATHPETAQIEATKVSFDELRGSLHDHECQMGLCECECGCQDGPFCTLVFGKLCSVCSVRDMRGDKNHGLKDQESIAQ